MDGSGPWNYVATSRPPEPEKKRFEAQDGHASHLQVWQAQGQFSLVFLGAMTKLVTKHEINWQRVS